MNFEQWREFYLPQLNQVAHKSWYNGTMFEPAGSELMFVKQVVHQYPDRVWTLYWSTDVDDKPTLYLTDEFKHLGAHGYFITKVPAQKGFEDIAVPQL